MVIYDIMPIDYYANALEDTSLQQSLWTDFAQAESYATDLVDLCGDNDNSCYTDGNRWSIVYTLCGVTMILLAANSGLMILGAWSFHARGLAACCGSIIVTPQRV